MYKKYNPHTVDYQGMIPDTTPSINQCNIESQVRLIIEKKGINGWIRVAQCEKEYEKSNPNQNPGTIRTRFYRWIVKVEKRKAPGFQLIKFPDNLSYLGLSNSNPKKLDQLAANDKEIVEMQSFSNIYYTNAFKKLEEICSLATGYKSIYASPDIALRELFSFIATLPRELKENIKPLQDQALEVVTRHGKMPLTPRYYKGEVQALRDLETIPDQDFLNDCYYWVLKLVDKITSLIHEKKRKYSNSKLMTD
jgi:hypothetical protein